MSKADLYDSIKAILKVRMIDPRELEAEAEGEGELEGEAEGEIAANRYRKDALFRSRVDGTTSQLMMLLTK